MSRRRPTASRRNDGGVIPGPLRSPADVLLREELEALAKAHPERFSLWLVVDAVPEEEGGAAAGGGQQRQRWEYSVGHITKARCAVLRRVPPAVVQPCAVSSRGAGREASAAREAEFLSGPHLLVLVRRMSCWSTSLCPPPSSRRLRRRGLRQAPLTAARGRRTSPPSSAGRPGSRRRCRRRWASSG